MRDLDAVTSARDAARKEHTELRKARLDEFMAGFNVITMKLKEMYQVTTRGSHGLAALILVSMLFGSLEGFCTVYCFSSYKNKHKGAGQSVLSGY